jgi:hypothetical protein
MFSSRSHRVILALVLGVMAIGSPWAAAQPRAIELGREPRIVTMQSDVLARLWETLGRVFLKTGCSIDPHGASCQAGAGSNAPAQADTGCSIDPNGRCVGGH